MTILQILTEINADTKRSHKLSLLEKHKNNATFMRVVKLALDPYTNFYIRKIPEYESKGNQSLDWALDELDRLSSRQYTGHAGIEHLRYILSNVSKDDAVVISRIIGKDLRCGMAEGIVNAVVEKFIPEYPSLLARPYDDKNIKNIVYPAYSQLKADGVRANAHVNGRDVFLCGRSGREIDLLGALDIPLQNLAAKFPWPVVFDGEFVVVDDNEKIINRKTGNGIINKAIKGTISQKEALRVRFQIWDAIPLHEFKLGQSSEDYKSRFERLVQIVEADTANHRPYWAIPYRIVNSLAEAEEHFQLMLSQGQEGIILKNYSGIWEDSRSADLVKMKAEKDCDLEIIGWNPGSGKYQNMVGSLQMASSDRLVEVNISGFSDELRIWITENIDSLIGRIAAIMYNERIKSKERGRENIDSLFLPRFTELRDDKIHADSSKEIK